MSGSKLPDLRVLAFAGEENIGRGYTFDLVLLSEPLQAGRAVQLQNDLMQAKLLTLTGRRDTGESFERHGVAEEVRLLFSAGGAALFRLTLRPRVFRLDLSLHSRIFMNMALPQLLDKLMREEGFTSGSDFEVKFGSGCKSRPLTCQYNESSFNFLSRHLERVGGYSYLAQTGGGDVLILADETTEVPALPVRDDLTWSEQKADEVVHAFVRSLKAGPAKVCVRDYSSDRPGMTTTRAEDARNLRGGGELSWYAGFGLFGEVDASGKAFSAQDAEEQAGKLSAARLRDLVSRSNRATGESNVPWMQAGHAFSLSGERFQLITVRHVCNQAGDTEDEKLLLRAADLGSGLDGAEKGYRNSFICHPLALGPFAPELRAGRPSVGGLVHAKIDASGSGAYAELDKDGRYKVKFFFPEKVIAADAVVEQDGNYSIPLRMMQAHAGASSGIHFPLLKGAEVLVAFTDGDPDRPVIMGAMPNPEHPSVVVDESSRENIIKTPGGHTISLTDTEGKKNMTLETPGGNKIVMNDEAGKRELRLQFPGGGGFIRLHEK
jgi:type VI secretion system secreted protein VgrG